MQSSTQEELVEDSMEFVCEKCRKKFFSKRSLEQHVSMKHVDEKKIFHFRKAIIICLVMGIVVFTMINIVSYVRKPGNFDSFAQCLTEKGVVIYGNDFCSYTNKQLDYFGKSKNHLNYIKCINNEKLCDSKGITKTPTWEIGGKMYENVQTFQRLSELTGCEI